MPGVGFFICHLMGHYRAVSFCKQMYKAYI